MTVAEIIALIHAARQGWIAIGAILELIERAETGDEVTQEEVDAKMADVRRAVEKIEKWKID